METGPSPIFFPEDSTKIQFELAGLLARLAFCGLPVLPQARQWQRLQKHYRGLQLRVQLRHRTGFPFQMSYFKHEEHQVLTTRHEEILSETWRFSLRSLRLDHHQPIRRKSRK